MPTILILAPLPRIFRLSYGQVSSFSSSATSSSNFIFDAALRRGITRVFCGSLPMLAEYALGDVKPFFVDLVLAYGNMGCRVFKRGVQNWKDVCLKINIPKGN